LYEEKMDLGPLMSELSGITNIASQNGSLWAWSDDMFTRKDEFSAAFQAAIAPFFNKYYQLK
jgi:non-canonical (house-cleaning) NTP pyrophosphatase